MKNQEEAAIAGTVSSMALAGLGGIAGGMGNLDSTGGSTFGEQIGNFFSGLGGGTTGGGGGGGGGGDNV